MLKHFPRLKWTILQVWDAEFRADNDPLRLDNFSWEVMQDLLYSTIGRALWSKRQLFEVMADFWSNHLNVTCPGDTWDSRHLYDSQVIRKYAFGKYKDMLLASAKHPAMLLYLNNEESTKQHPNENYGRELLELHTVGVDGGYDENDIYDSARDPHRPDPEEPQPGYRAPTPNGRGGSSSSTRRSTTPRRDDPRASRSNHAASTGLRPRTTSPTLARHRKTAERIAYKLAALRLRRPAELPRRSPRRRLPGERHRDRAGAAGAVHLARVHLLRRA